jgi:WhiB family transcriptional regulator, redox-sensing transcriptional regulator
MPAAALAAPWQDLAACRGTDTDRFFPISYKGRSAADIDVAVRICRSCPVRQPCLAYALSTAQTYGIWGGTTERQRKLLRRRRTNVRRSKKDGDE